MNTVAKKEVSADVSVSMATLQVETRVPSYEMDVDMVDGIPTTQSGWKGTHDISLTLAKLPKLSESRWATYPFSISSSPNVTPATGILSSNNENVKPATKPAFNSFDINKSIASEISKSFGVTSQSLAPSQPTQNPLLANGFVTTATPNPTPAQSAQLPQNPFTTDLNAASISRNIADELARGVGSARAPGANGFSANQEPRYSAPPLRGPATGWASVSAPVQNNAFNPGTSSLADPLFGATAQTNVPKSSAGSNDATLATKDKVFYLADSRWAR